MNGKKTTRRTILLSSGTILSLILGGFLPLSAGAAFVEEQKIFEATGIAVDQFANRSQISADGTRLVLGKVRHDGAFLNQGAAYVYVRSGTTWTLEQVLLASDAQADDQLGVSVSINADGSRIAAAANTDDVGANANQGSVYVFSRSGTVWTEEQRITASDGAAGDGMADVFLDSDGSRLLAGVPADDVGANANQGSVYLFTRSGTVWTEEQKLTTSDGAASDVFGAIGRNVISADGTRIISGVPGDDIGANTNQGSAYVFSRSGTVWTQEQKIVLPDGALQDNFANSVSMDSDGSRVAIAAQTDEIGAVLNHGTTYVYSRSGTVWTQEQRLAASDFLAGDVFGSSVFLNSDASRLIIGASSDDVGANANQGSVYLFTRSGTVWTEEEKITTSDGATNDSFSNSISIDADGARFLASVFSDDIGLNADQGSAYVFFSDLVDSVLDPISISSDNADPSTADVGDTVTLAFTSDEALASASVTFLSGGAAITNPATVASTSDDELDWEASYEVSASDTEGAVTFTIKPEDESGNDGTTYSATTDASSVTFAVPETSSQRGSSFIPTPTPTPDPMLGTPPNLAQFGLTEGDTISVDGTTDPDVYIVNQWGYKRLFLNPVIFGFYGHLGGFAGVRIVAPAVRDAFVTSGLFRNCESNAREVYALEVTGEDTGIFHHVALTGEQAVAQDPNFFRKVFCINDREFGWYPKSATPYTSLAQLPAYRR